MKLQSRAKVNLFLKILGKREDGYHDLQTLMIPVSLADEVEVEESDDGEIHLAVEGMALSCGEDNLAWKAADAVRRVGGVDKGVRIILRKRIPMGGGLAGGSSNAAAVIRGVNELWGNVLTKEQMDEVAAGLGSDINFFLQDGAALCEGRGERVTPVEFQQDLWALLVNPGFEVSTPWAFKAYAKGAGAGRVGGYEMVYGQSVGEGEVGVGRERFSMCNDLEPAVFSKYLWLEEAKGWFLEQGEVVDALMSGSGATVFGLVEGEEDLRKVENRAREFFGSTIWMEGVRLLGRADD